MTGTVLEEGLRGAGGCLLDGEGRALHARLRLARRARDARHRLPLDHSPRSAQGHATPNGGVYLRCAISGPTKCGAQFKGMVERCADCGFDLAGGRVEVVPTAHYMMGGVVFAPDCTTSTAGLFAAGEDTGGVHGANRLGGNGVANSTVFGAIAGDSMARGVLRESGRLAESDPAAIEAALRRAFAPLGRRPATSITVREGSITYVERGRHPAHRPMA